MAMSLISVLPSTFGQVCRINSLMYQHHLASSSYVAVVVIIGNLEYSIYYSNQAMTLTKSMSEI